MSNRIQNFCPRLIEVALPIREISAESVRDKNIHHAHISHLHIWWARRPLAASRAVVFASLVPDPDDPQCPQEFRDAVERHLKTHVPSALRHYRRGRETRRDDEVEAIAMDVAMRYERSRGWTPTDVSQDGEHYDVRSEGPNGEKRFIEVKGRSESGAIVLTGPEVDKLRQLADRAWLYIVTFCKQERPTLRIIQDPISKLSPEMLYRQVQFLVQQSDWATQGEEINQMSED